MALAPGSRLGAYEIVSLLGSGGMGEVYRATDIVLKRQVALKVLPAEVAYDPERAARFQREAEVLAALNHPNVAHLYGVEQSNPSPGSGQALSTGSGQAPSTSSGQAPSTSSGQGGALALAMELVEGETLADRIAKGAVPLDEALPIAKQIAEAVAAAHEQGIIHRDLKPANIKVRDDGTVKVLDFGLAKALEPELRGVSAAALTNSPTITAPAMTALGVLLGTAAYMSPEQARGKRVDKRSDIWAFGVVVFEMITGNQAFSGETAGDLLARVIEREPDWRLLPDATPPALRRLLERCLQKDVTKRWQHMGDVALELEFAAKERGGPADQAAPPRAIWREAAGWAVAVAIGIVAGVLLWGRDTETPQPVTAFELRAPAGLTFGIFQAAPYAALAPDGRSLVFEASKGSSSSLWIRTLEDNTPRELPTTRDGYLPFWSPDGRAIAFSRAGKLFRADVVSGSPQVICDLPPDADEGGAWGENGTILLGSRSGGIFRVAAVGGVAQPVTSLADGETSHHWPTWLPGEQTFLYRSDKGTIFRASLDGTPPRRVLDADSRVEFVAPGLLFFAKGTALVAQRFDPVSGALSGEPSIVSETVRLGASGRAMFSVRPNALVFRSGALSEPGFTWDVYDSRGQVLRSLPLRILRSFVLSPDGSRIALHSHDSGTGDGEFSLVQLASGEVTRIYAGPLHYDYPVWSPDGSRLAVTSADAMKIIRADGAPDAEVAVRGGIPTDWVARGDWIVYSSGAPNSGQDILALPLSGDRTPRVLVQPRADDRNGVVSPDGEWLAFTSLESGRPEVYIQRFPAGGSKTAMSRSGGSHPRWDPKGTALYYWSADERVMRVPVHFRGSTPQASEPVAVLTLKNTGPQYGMDSNRSPYVLGPDGVGFIGAQGDGVAVDAVLRVVLNWQEELKQRMSVD